MSVIKDLFEEKYGECNTRKILDYQQPYKMPNFSRGRPESYSVDCLFHKGKKVSGERCDEIVFFDVPSGTTGIYLVERKTNSQDVAKVKQQLQGGAEFIEKFLKRDHATGKQPPDFMPVWVSKGLTRSVFNKLKTVRISLRNIKKPVKHVKKNGELPRIHIRPS